MVELKPCPFCGSDATVDANFGREWWVQCNNEECAATTGLVPVTRHEAIALWNRRTSDGVEESGRC